MINIVMRKITELEGFEVSEFCIQPGYWGFIWENPYKAQKLFNEARKLAEDVDGICIAIITDALGEYTLGKSCGLSSRFILFNAEETCRSQATVRAIIHNMGKNALPEYSFDKWIKYNKGSIC